MKRTQHHREWVWLNGRFCVAQAARVSISDPGFTHGEGVFETLLVRTGIMQLPHEHFARLCRSARTLGLNVPVSLGDFVTVATALVRRNQLTKGMLRVILTPQTFLLTTRPWPERPVSAVVMFIAMERCLPNLKTLNYLPTVLAQRAAERRGFDEALLVDRDGHVTEGGRTNVFWVRRGILCTPPLGRALPGVTRAKILMLARRLKIPTSEKITTPVDIRTADEVFLTNAPMEVWPVTRVERRRLPVGEVTCRIADAYEKKYGAGISNFQFPISK